MRIGFLLTLIIFSSCKDYNSFEFEASGTHKSLKFKSTMLLTPWGYHIDYNGYSVLLDMNSKQGWTNYKGLITKYNVSDDRNCSLSFKLNDPYNKFEGNQKCTQFLPLNEKLKICVLSLKFDQRWSSKINSAVRMSFMGWGGDVEETGMDICLENHSDDHIYLVLGVKSLNNEHSFQVTNWNKKKISQENWNELKRGFFNDNR